MWGEIGYCIGALADLLMPRRCIVCGRKLLVRECHLCLYCRADIPYTGYELRSRNPMADRLNGRIDGDGERYAYATALFFYSHDAGYRHIPYRLKYHGDISVGEEFGRMLGKRMLSSPHFGDIDAVVPVPLHWTRRFRRGYNQAEIIAGAISQVIGKPLRTDILVRRRRTATQTKLDLEEKERNVSGAFAVSLTEPAGELAHILLVDDVFTTGATIGACFDALRTVFPPKVRISVACLCFVEN